jgi:hypothetical protein
VLPKNADRAVKRCIRIEFPRSCHEPYLAIQERMFKNSFDTRANTILALSHEWASIRHDRREEEASS